jgi:ketosteroid isomerase-like protein
VIKAGAGLDHPVLAEKNTPMDKKEKKMKTRLIHIMIIFTILMLNTAVCTACTDRLSPEETVLKMVKRMNAGDVEGSLAYFADDAIIYFTGMPPAGIEIYRGKEQIRPVWKDSVDNHFKWEVEVVSADKQIVTTRAKTWHDFTRQLGVAPNEYSDVYEVKNGKITVYDSVITQESLAKFKPALAKVMPTSPTPAISSETPVSEVTVTISDGTCGYNGPMILKAGKLTVNVNATDRAKEKYAVSFLTLNADKDIVDLMASTSLPYPASWSNMVFIKELGPNESQNGSFTAAVGRLYLVCWSNPPDIAIGSAGPFEVVP